jgi:hypothetical protein
VKVDKLSGLIVSELSTVHFSTDALLVDNPTTTFKANCEEILEVIIVIEETEVSVYFLRIS